MSKYFSRLGSYKRFGEGILSFGEVKGQKLSVPGDTGRIRDGARLPDGKRAINPVMGMLRPKRGARLDDLVQPRPRDLSRDRKGFAWRGPARL